ncbi:MAG: carboxypeptidase-like regulatory domain-containing protein [Acidobacteriota bacterium]
MSTKKKRTNSVRRLSLIFAAGMAAVALGMAPGGGQGAGPMPAAQAQNLGDRTVTGTVLDAESNPAAGATVFLKNDKTKAIRSFTSLSNGHFHFAQVSKSQDYDLWAEKDGKKSAIKTVSSWDARTEFVSDLKLK